MGVLAVMSGRIVNVLAVLVLLALSLAILGSSMTKPLGRDEHMYCTGGVLMAQGKTIYRDFAYPTQLPYHPLLYAAIYKITDTQHYLLTGRLVSTLCDILIAICILAIFCRAFKSRHIEGLLPGSAGLCLYLFNPFVNYANGYAWNHDFVILCVILSYWLFISTDFQAKSKY